MKEKRYVPPIGYLKTKIDIMNEAFALAEKWAVDIKELPQMMRDIGDDIAQEINDQSL